jgi:aminoglycoside/choline kinase family phosphotransferase
VNINNKSNIDSEKISDDKNRLIKLFQSAYECQSVNIHQLAGAGSNRRYYKLEQPNGEAIIGTCGDDAQENRAFVALANHFRSKGLAVPEVLAVSPDCSHYLQSFAGSKSLFEALADARSTGNYTAADLSLLEDAMRKLAAIQYVGGADLDFSQCYPCEAMNSRLVNWDLNYFKYCFLKPTGTEFDEAKLQDEFDRLHNVIMQEEASWTTFMYRDFQSRNVMVAEDGTLTMIDFQGGRRGPAAYDVASFLWQAKARYPEEVKHRMIDVYLEAAKQLNPSLDVEAFKQRLPYFVLFRMLQTLGAYGFRGWIERKPHFLESVPMGTDNLHDLLRGELAAEFPLLTELANEFAKRYGSEAVAAERGKYLHRIAAAENPLTVRVTSFSFKKGIPEDPSGNGGGFVFDCRAPHNPGRYEPYKKLTGLDKPVRDFLEQDGEILPFIEQCKQIVSGSVERYLQRGFTSLSINFGCTGGQHRSVYSADAIGRYLNEKYGVRVELSHREQGISEVLPAKDVAVLFDSYLRNPQKKFNPESASL